jgi:hypothetical protein
MTLGSVEGEQLQILGDKDENGIASNVHSLILDDKEGNTTFVTLNTSTTLPDRVTTDSGVVIVYEWSDDLSMVHVTAVSPDGRFQVTVNVNLTTSVSSVTRHVKRDVGKRGFSSHSESRTKRQSGREGTASVPVAVYQCDQPETNARVYGLALLNYDKDAHSWAGERLYTAVSTDTEGVYHIQLSTGTQSTIGQAVEEVCEQVVTVLGHSCTLSSRLSKTQEEAICLSIAAAAEILTAFIPGDSIVINRACSAGFRALRFYCNTLGQSAPGGPSIADLVCESVSFTDSLIDLFDKDTIFLQPYAEFPDGRRVDSGGQVLEIAPGISGILPYSFTIRDVEAEPVITSLIVDPADPDPREDYVVHVTYTCPTPSMSVYMTIVGTDLYTGETSCRGVSYFCTLNVPGADELVRDLVTVQVTDELVGFAFTRKVVVVF